MKEKVKYLFIIILIISIILNGVFAFFLISNINKKIELDDIIGKWTYTDPYRKKITIEFKKDGNMVYTDSYPGSTFEYGFKLSYGDNSVTYITINCPYNTPSAAKENKYCYFADFQDIDIVDKHLCFLGGSFQVCFKKEK